jgi:hypothetical protein
MWRARAADDFATIRMRIEALHREGVEALGPTKRREPEQRSSASRVGPSRFATWRSGG